MTNFPLHVDSQYGCTHKWLTTSQTLASWVMCHCSSGLNHKQ